MSISNYIFLALPNDCSALHKDITVDIIPRVFIFEASVGSLSPSTGC